MRVAQVLWILMIAAAPAAAVADPLHVLTPATPQRWIASQGKFLFIYRDSSGDESRAGYLRRWAKEDRFDLARRTQAAMLEAVATRGRLALPLAVTRPEQLEPGALARDRLPTATIRGEMLDVAVEWFGMTSTGPFAKYQPFVRISYRVLDSRGSLLQPSRIVYYGEVKGTDLPKGETIAADPECAWKDVPDMAKERRRVWACFGAALEKVAEHVAAQLVPEAAAPSAAAPAATAPADAAAEPRAP